MKILKHALDKIKSIGKNKKNFLIQLIQGLIGVTDKRTFRNMSRYTEIEEHTFSRQMAKSVDFSAINTEMIEATKGEDEILIAAHDTSFISKSGKATHGLGFFWNGSESKIEKGLEIDVIAVVKISADKRDAYTISVEQSTGDLRPKAERKKKKATEETKIDFALNHVKKITSNLQRLGVKYIAADAFYAKTKYVNGVVEIGLHVISKLRKDARLLRLYTGPQKKRGRKRKYDKSSVSTEDFKSSPVIAVDDEQIDLYSTVAHSVSLDCSIKVVLVRKIIDAKRYGEAFLFSTDIEMDALQVYQLYVARFQIEFVFRDAKGFTGLTDCQSRDGRRLNYHFNASLLALNVAKLQDQELQKKNRVSHPFSMTNWARKYHVEFVINRFILMFGLDPTLIKLHPDYERFLEFANIIH